MEKDGEEGGRGFMYGSERKIKEILLLYLQETREKQEKEEIIISNIITIIMKSILLQFSTCLFFLSCFVAVVVDGSEVGDDNQTSVTTMATPLEEIERDGIDLPLVIKEKVATNKEYRIILLNWLKKKLVLYGSPAQRHCVKCFAVNFNFFFKF